MLRIELLQLSGNGFAGRNNVWNGFFIQPTPTSDKGLSPSSSSPDFSIHTTTYSIIAGDLLLPGTDTSAIADEPPQHDKGFEFPDGTFALPAELGF